MPATWSLSKGAATPMPTFWAVKNPPIAKNKHMTRGNCKEIPAVMILVGVSMFQAVTQVPFDRLEVAVPAFATLMLIPLTFSITQGILWGFILHAALHALVGRAREVRPSAWALAVVSVALLVLEHAY